MSGKEESKHRNEGLIKARPGGFVKGKPVEPEKKSATDRIDASFEKRIDKLAYLMRQSFEDAMAPTQPINTRVNAASKLMGLIHRPAQKVSIESDSKHPGIVLNITNVDSLSPEDRALFERARKAAGSKEIIEAEVVEEEDGV